MLEGDYIGATQHEMEGLKLSDRLAGIISQRAMFPRRGKIALDENLTLTGWGDGGDLVLAPADVRDVSLRFTEEFGRLDAGLFKEKPLIVETATDRLYLLVDRRELSEATHNESWSDALNRWRTGG